VKDSCLFVTMQDDSLFSLVGVRCCLMVVGSLDLGLDFIVDNNVLVQQCRQKVGIVLASDLS